MTTETAKTVSELYKAKSDLLNDLSNVENKENNLDICYTFSPRHYYGSGNIPLNVSKLIREELKNFVKDKINLEIQKVDNQLNQIKCE